MKPEKFKYARKLRANPTPAEATLWNLLQAKKYGIKFRRQAPILGWIVDFYCPAARLVIEVDGPVHDGLKKLDAHKDHVLKQHDLNVIRIKNSEVYEQPVETAKKISALAHKLAASIPRSAKLRRA